MINLKYIFEEKICTLKVSEFCLSAKWQNETGFYFYNFRENERRLIS